MIAFFVGEVQRYILLSALTVLSLMAGKHSDLESSLTPKAGVSRLVTALPLQEESSEDKEPYVSCGHNDVHALPSDLLEALLKHSNCMIFGESLQKIVKTWLKRIEEFGPHDPLKHTAMLLDISKSIAHAKETGESYFHTLAYLTTDEQSKWLKSYTLLATLEHCFQALLHIDTMPAHFFLINHTSVDIILNLTFTCCQTGHAPLLWPNPQSDILHDLSTHEEHSVQTYLQEIFQTSLMTIQSCFAPQHPLKKVKDTHQCSQETLRTCTLDPQAVPQDTNILSYLPLWYGLWQKHEKQKHEKLTNLIQKVLGSQQESLTKAVAQNWNIKFDHETPLFSLNSFTQLCGSFIGESPISKDDIRNSWDNNSQSADPDTFRFCMALIPCSKNITVTQGPPQTVWVCTDTYERIEELPMLSRKRSVFKALLQLLAILRSTQSSGQHG